ncbi:MAG: metal-dependent transcriptional regulator [Myxococcales bacterium]|nr:metal-dependent transcriptional regulator [Myxococcales bacterium]MCB9530895.1 metal-dependent transcriptional regulator [Myxococcales bacterium]
MPTISAENYLKAIYHLVGTRDARVKTKELAGHLGVSLPSVTSMLRTLADRGLVDYEAYRGAALTSHGELAALAVIRKHRLVESFLVATLGYRWDEVHDEAELLEHAVSDDLAARIERFLGFPTVDPHGDPIPSAAGVVRHPATVPLSQAVPDRPARLVRVLEQSPEALKYLDGLGLVPDAVATVLEVLPSEGPLIVATPSGRTTIARELARHVLVEQD